jgi:serine/threonine-protein kinase
MSKPAATQRIQSKPFVPSFLLLARATVAVTALQDLVARWPEINALLDEALVLPVADREPWLARLTDERATLRDTVSRLLAAHASLESGSFLGTLPRLVLPVGAAANANAVDLTEPAAGAQVGPYRLLQLLGQGGMGAVWLAERSDGQLKRQVALKLPRMLWGAAAVERMTRERDILAALSHPHIARLYDAGVDAQGRPYLAMEYVQGQTIDAYCNAQGLPVQPRLHLLLQVATAVAHAHARLVVHRDLKPANILVTGDGQVRLLDFGIAKLMEGERTEETALTRAVGRVLTLEYASPEQVRGEPLGTASDVYSLAVVAYELLAGCRPYPLKRGTAAELEEAITLLDPPLASEAAVHAAVRKSLRGDLDAILNQALRKAPDERYASVAEFARDVERHLRGEPVVARPDTLHYRAGRFARRHWLPLSAGTAVVIALSAGGLTALTQAREARQQATLAAQQAEVARQESRRAEAVQGFLLDIFRANADTQADPAKARATTARELLDIGAARLDQTLGDQPEVRERVLGTLSSMYGALGLGERAAVLTEQRLALLRQLHGRDDRRVVDPLLELARWLQSTPRRAEILPALLEAKRVLDAAGDTQSEQRGHLLTRLAQRHQNISITQMKAFADEAIGVLRPLRKPDQDVMSFAFDMGARSRVLLGEPAAAELLYQESEQEMRRASPVSPLLLEQLRLGQTVALAAQEKGAEALAVISAAERELVPRLGEDDTASIWLRSRLALLMHGMGQREAALALHQRTLVQVLRVLGEADTLLTPQVRLEYAQSLFAEGRYGEALALIERVLAVRRVHYAGAASLAFTMQVQADILTALNRFDEARALLTEATPIWQKGNGPGLQAWRNNRFHLAWARLELAQRDADAAAAHLGRVVARPPSEALAVPLEEVERDLLLVKVQLLHGEREAARQQLQALQAPLGMLPMKPDLQRLRQLAQRLQKEIP